MTGRSLSALGFLQIYRNKTAQHGNFTHIFSRNNSSEQFGENICLKFPMLGSFLVINLKKPQSRKWSTCQSFKKFTLISEVFVSCILCWKFKNVTLNNVWYKQSDRVFVFSFYLCNTAQCNLQNPWFTEIFAKCCNDKTSKNTALYQLSNILATYAIPISDQN